MSTFVKVLTAADAVKLASLRRDGFKVVACEYRVPGRDATSATLAVRALRAARSFYVTCDDPGLSEDAVARLIDRAVAALERETG